MRLPAARWSGVRLLGPTPAEAAKSAPLRPIDRPHGVLQFFIGGLCDEAGAMVTPVEIGLLIEPAAVPAAEPIPLDAALTAAIRFAEWHAQRPGLPGFRVQSLICRETGEMGPTFYCRKKHSVFVARSPNTGEPLKRMPPGDNAEEELPRALVSWDGPAEAGRNVAIYAPQRAATGLGSANSFEQMILDQGGVVRLAADWYSAAPAIYSELAAAHTCCGCEERQRCYPSGGGYAFAVDRLTVINAAQLRPPVLPLGEFSLREAADFIGGGSLLNAAPPADADTWLAWRGRIADQIANAAPRMLLAGESGGREILEILRLKLGLVVEAFEQLATSWRTAQTPHLCWNDETIRFTWRQPAHTPAAAWGLRPILRKAGLQPVVPLGADTSPPVPFTPSYSDPALLPPEVIEVSRYFGQPRPANVLVRTVEPKGEESAAVRLVIEDLGIPRELFCEGDILNIEGDGWRAVLVPAAATTEEGSGLAAVGRVRGKIAGIQPGAEFAGCAVWWYPRFGEAVDLHALGMLLLECLLAHDERPPQRLREELLQERGDLTRACEAVALEQREAQAQTWIGARCATDTPASLWTRRNLLHTAAGRSTARLEGLPARLWEAAVALALRMTTLIGGFSYCARRDQAAPRLSDGAVLPLIELRGLLALLDDALFQRTAAADAMRGRVKA